MDSGNELKWQQYWEKEGTFIASPNEEKKKYFITVPYPYTNAPLHIGHGRTYLLADIIARFHRINGYNVLYPMAFHQSGTPILALSQRIRSGDESMVKMYTNYLSLYENDPKEIKRTLASFSDPKNIADYFSAEIIKDFSLMGFSIDWSRRFTTSDPVYQEFVKWQFLKLNDLGYIKKGTYPVLYSVEDENAVGEDDIKDGDIDKVSIEEYTGVIFRGREFSLVAASLRPETIFGVTNLWISDRGDYLLCTLNGAKVVLSRSSFEKLVYQNYEISLVREIKRSEILGEEFEAPLSGRKVNVYESTIVNPDNGTGIVYSVPGHSIWDYAGIMNSNFHPDPIKIIDVPDDKNTVESLYRKMKIQSVQDSEKLREATQILYKEEYYSGRLNDQNDVYSGMSVKEARDAIIADLKKLGLSIVVYETSRVAETRSGAKVIVAIMKDQWFIDYSNREWKDRTRALVDSMDIFPSSYRESIKEVIEWLRERPCARKRGIGTRLPFDQNWIIESLSDSTIYPVLYTCYPYLVRIFEKIREITTDILDHIMLGYPLPDGKYDSDVTAQITEARKEKEYWYGVDLRLTATPHLTNHLVFYLMNHVALFSGKDLPHGIAISGLVIVEGSKIGKSKGNAIPLSVISNKYSADIYRLYMSISADPQSVIDWKESEIQSVLKKYQSLVEILSSVNSTSIDNGNMSEVEKWFISVFRLRMASFVDSIRNFNIRQGIVSIFFDVMNDIKRLERRGGSRSRMLQLIAGEWLKALSVVIPFVSEEQWHRLDLPGSVANAQLDSYSPENIDRDLLERESYIDRVEEDIRSILKVIGKEPVRINIYVAGDDQRSVMMAVSENRTKSIQKNLLSLIPEAMKVRNLVSIYKFDELSVLRENADYFRTIFNAEIHVDKAVIQKGKNAWPGRPLIRIE
ncbi:MAG: leucine--tRNA ligase [Thermoplasmata archaeon]